jgi:hypothetical protein
MVYIYIILLNILWLCQLPQYVMAFIVSSLTILTVLRKDLILDLNDWVFKKEIFQMIFQFSLSQNKPVPRSALVGNLRFQQFILGYIFLTFISLIYIVLKYFIGVELSLAFTGVFFVFKVTTTVLLAFLVRLRNTLIKLKPEYTSIHSIFRRFVLSESGLHPTVRSLYINYKMPGSSINQRCGQLVNVREFQTFANFFGNVLTNLYTCRPQPRWLENSVYLAGTWLIGYEFHLKTSQEIRERNQEQRDQIDEKRRENTSTLEHEASNRDLLTHLQSNVRDTEVEVERSRRFVDEACNVQEKSWYKRGASIDTDRCQQLSEDLKSSMRDLLVHKHNYSLQTAVVAQDVRASLFRETSRLELDLESLNLSLNLDENPEVDSDEELTTEAIRENLTDSDESTITDLLTFVVDSAAIL